MKEGILFVIFILLVIFGAYPVKAEVPLPADLHIEKPEFNTSGSGFFGESGIWEGVYRYPESTLEVIIAFEKIDKDAVSLIYSTPVQYERSTGEFYKGDFNHIRFSLKSGATVDLSLDPSGKKMRVRYIKPGGIINEADLTPRTR